MKTRIERLNELRAKKKKFKKIKKKDVVDRLILHRHKTTKAFKPRIEKLTKETGDDGQGKYKSVYYSKSAKDKSIKMNPTTHTCDDYPDYCQHNKYKATDQLKLVHTGDVTLKWGLRAKKEIPFESPLGLCNGVFRKKIDGDDKLHHIIFMSAEDVEYDTLYDCSDPKNIQKANAFDEFVLDIGDDSNGGIVKYINTTCVEESVNAQLYRLQINAQ